MFRREQSHLSKSNATQRTKQNAPTRVWQWVSLQNDSVVTNMYNSALTPYPNKLKASNWVTSAKCFVFENNITSNILHSSHLKLISTIRTTTAHFALCFMNSLVTYAVRKIFKITWTMSVKITIVIMQNIYFFYESCEFYTYCSCNFTYFLQHKTIIDNIADLYVCVRLEKD